jgi:hypothetical protein
MINPSNHNNNTNKPDPKAMSTLVASELNQLSLSEREGLYDDLHGVCQTTEELPEKIAELCSSLQQEITKLKGRSAYDKALFLCPSYVLNPDFLRMFLRSQNFNVRDAAQRMVQHFQFKLELFGIERLARDIRLSDLDPDDQTALRSGSVQLLPQKDRSGRTIFLLVHRLLNYKAPINQVRTVLFCR